MTHRIMGVKTGEDFPLYEQTISIATLDLKRIMGWRDDEDSLHDYKLTSQQIIDIEKACALSLPPDLDLYLTSQL